jgi:hypothetical protein
MFSVTLEEMTDPTMQDTSYAILQECSIFLICCNGCATKGSLSFLGDKSILLKAGSKVFVHCGKDGRVLAAVVVPIDGHLSLPWIYCWQWANSSIFAFGKFQL